jgi:integrase
MGSFLWLTSCLPYPGTALGARVRVSNNLQQFASLSTPALRFRFQHTRRVSVCAVLALPLIKHCKGTACALHTYCTVTARVLHKFSHSYARRCLDSGCTIHQVSRWLGHADLSVTSIYLSGDAGKPDNDPFGVIG